MSGSERTRRRERRNKACDNKTTYQNELAALQAAIRFDMTWYRCRYCGRWHLTSKYRGTSQDNG